MPDLPENTQAKTEQISALRANISTFIASAAAIPDEANDFKNVNAASVQRYASSEKGEILGHLQATADEFLAYLDDLEPSAWTEDYGVPGESGRPNLIINYVAALAADYLGHAQEITGWTRQGQS